MLSAEGPTKLGDLRMIGCAMFPDNCVLTFRYIDRHRSAPFDLSWRQVKALTRDRLCVDQKAFLKWLNKQLRNKARAQKLAFRNPAGRPAIKREQTIKALRKLRAQGRLKVGTPIKKLHLMLSNIDPSLNVAPDTVRRAVKEFCGKKISGTSAAS
jgi:hypothetical protein